MQASLLRSTGSYILFVVGMGESAESSHTVGRCQQEAYQAMLHKGNTEYLKRVSHTEPMAALGLLTTALWC